MILFSHPLSTPFTREAALALAEAGLLAELRTCLHWTPGNGAERFLPAALARELGRRSYPPAVRARVRTAPWREAGRLLATRLPALQWLARHETGPCSMDAVFHSLDRATARRVRKLSRDPGADLRGVYAYEDGAAATFRAARRAGVKCFYDLPIGYWRAGQRIFAEEAERVPAWAATITGRGDSAAKLARKDEELAGADAVIVASSFTKQTLAEAPALRAPVCVVPYGAPTGPVAEPPAGSKKKGQPLRALFVGILSQRKGISYLLEAAAALGRHVELTLLGTKPVADCPALDAAARAHRWIPTLPHAEVLAEMERQDVLVFPSLFEGFGLVILEAMSRGVPVITTAHTAGPDLIADGEDGFIVPIRSAAAIAEKTRIALSGTRAAGGDARGGARQGGGRDLGNLSSSVGAGSAVDALTYRFAMTASSSSLAAPDRSVAVPVSPAADLRPLRWLVWLYLGLWIFEGALRKWFLPGLANPLLIVRDPVLLSIYALALAKGIFPRNAFIAWITILGGAALVVSMGATNAPLLVELYGLRADYLHLPLIFLMPTVLRREDLRAAGRWALTLAVPMAMLVLAQFGAGRNSRLNAGAGANSFMLESTFGHIRPSGTFSYTNGLGSFTSLTMAFFLCHLLEKRVFPRLIWLAALPSLMVLIILSGSRGRGGDRPASCWRRCSASAWRRLATAHPRSSWWRWLPWAFS